MIKLEYKISDWQLTSITSYYTSIDVLLPKYVENCTKMSSPGFVRCYVCFVLFFSVNSWHHLVFEHIGWFFSSQMKFKCLNDIPVLYNKKLTIQNYCNIFFWNFMLWQSRLANILIWIRVCRLHLPPLLNNRWIHGYKISKDVTRVKSDDCAWLVYVSSAFVFQSFTKIGAKVGIHHFYCLFVCL